jgi:hypothetical protein
MKLGWPRNYVDIAHEQVQASEVKAQLLLHEQTQRSEMLVSELRHALKAITDQDIANTRASAEMKVQLRKELLETKHRLAELEPAWDMFTAKHNEEEEAHQDSEQCRRASVVAHPSKRRYRRLEIETNRVELRGVTSMPPSDAATTASRLATPRGADTDLSGAHAPGSTSTIGMFSPAVSAGAESTGELGPSSATVDSDAARVPEINRSNQSRHVQDTHPDSTGSSSMHPLRREELIPDSMRKSTLANLETKTLKAFRNIFAHHKNAHAEISDWVSYIPVELHTQVRAQIRSVVDPKTDKNRFTAAQVDNWQSMDVLTVLYVLLEPNAAALVDVNSLVVALENIELAQSEFFVSCYYETLEHQLSTIYRQFMLVYEDCRHEESTPQVRAMECAFKKSSEGQRLNKLIHEKNGDDFLHRSVDEYMNAAEDLASERSRGCSAKDTQVH